MMESSIFIFHQKTEEKVEIKEKALSPHFIVLKYKEFMLYSYYIKL